MPAALEAALQAAAGGSSCGLTQLAYFKASNSDAFDWFGEAVAISGDTAVIGARFEDSSATGVGGDQASNGSSNSGAAYVFVRNGATWTQQAYLKASNADAEDGFGGAVAISGDTIVIGAPIEDSSATGVNGNQSSNEFWGAGAAYVFVRSGTSWSQEAYLKSANTGWNDFFGAAVAIWGETIVVGAWGEKTPIGKGVFGSEAGAAYVFVRDGATWSQEARLEASNKEPDDLFGTAVAISGDTIGIGAPFEASSATGVNGDQANDDSPHSGAAYVFVRNGTSWSQQAYLKASNTGMNDQFGSTIAASGERLIVGAPNEASAATGVDGDQASNAAPFSGAAYVFVRSSTTWSQEAYLKASNTGPGDQFGGAVALSGTSALIGARHEDGGDQGPCGDAGSEAATDSGAAYLFTNNGGGWSFSSYLKSSNSEASDSFGSSGLFLQFGTHRGGTTLALSGDLALVGALGEDSVATGVDGDQSNNGRPQSGAAYVLQVSTLATVAFRNAGSNPASYVASPAVLGGAFTATVDNNLAGKPASLLFAFDSATSVALGGGQVLLCLDLGSGELFTGGNLYPSASSGGVDSYTLSIPNDPALAGVVACSQALQFGNPPFVLSNAQDLVIGEF